MKTFTDIVQLILLTLAKPQYCYYGNIHFIGITIKVYAIFFNYLVLITNNKKHASECKLVYLGIQSRIGQAVYLNVNRATKCGIM